MQHNIPAEKFGSLGQTMALTVSTCVHCGFCLPACPTYTILGEEMDSPRGRIVLMKSVLEGEIELEEALPYIDRCLGCLGCVTACPSGVPYGELLIPFRAYAQQQRSRPLVDALSHRLVLNTLPYPDRFRLAARAGRLARPIQGLLPGKLRDMLDLLPDNLPSAQPLPEFYPANGKRRARAVMLAGCVQQNLAPEINWATLRVLARNGVEVVIPAGQGCCGALAMHSGEMELARQQARHNLQIFPQDVDVILTNAAGCGSGMKEYPLLFKDTEWEDQAIAFAAKVQDVSVFLDRLGIEAPSGLPAPLKAAYHDACHLAHAQGVTEPPRRLLAHIPNLELVSFPEADLCCGSAGTYNLEQPELARRLGARKVCNIMSSGAEAVITGNIGCLVQLRAHLAGAGQTIPVWHTLQLLDRAYHEQNAIL